MSIKLSLKQKALFFVEQSNTDCRQCKNFSSLSCPAFKKAVDEDGINPEHLISAIEEEQKDMKLKSCSNA